MTDTGSRIPWLVGLAAMALVGYALAGTELNTIIVLLYYLVLMGYTYRFYTEGGFEQVAGLFRGEVS